jgi:hypothetical protein
MPLNLKGNAKFDKITIVVHPHAKYEVFTVMKTQFAIF